MIGGLAVQKNLLCVTWSSARGHVFLFDLVARKATSSWTIEARQERYSDAGGVAMDSHFQLFVADPQNHRVHCFSVFGKHLFDLGIAPVGDGAVARDRLGVLWRPNAVALQGDELWIAGGELPMRRAVQRFARDGRPLGYLRSQGDPAGEFGAPRGIWADASCVLVADTLHGQIQRFRPDGSYIASIAYGSPAKPARPIAVLQTQDQRVLAIDAGKQSAVLAFDRSGKPVSAGDLASHCEQGTAITCDEQQRVYLLDQNGERVQRFHPDLSFDTHILDLAEHFDGQTNAAP
jgi:hypothetical protein